MFCPSCFSEYREGFTECNDCRVALVDKLPDEPEPEFHEFLALMAGMNEIHIALIKAAFDEAGLDYYFDGEFANRLIPLPFATRLMVREDQAEEGQQILEELDLS